MDNKNTIKILTDAEKKSNELYKKLNSICFRDENSNELDTILVNAVLAQKKITTQIHRTPFCRQRAMEMPRIYLCRKEVLSSHLVRTAISMEMIQGHPPCLAISRAMEKWYARRDRLPKIHRLPSKSSSISSKISLRGSSAARRLRLPDR